MTLQEKLAKVNAQLEELSEEYRSGRTASAPLFKRIERLARRKVNLLEELRTVE